MAKERRERTIRYRVPSVEKAFAILEMFASDNRGYTMSEVGRSLDLPISTTSSLLYTMQHCGYLTRDARGRFSLTMKLLAEGSKALGQMQLHEVAEPFLKKLTAATSQASVLAIRDGDHMVYADKIEGTSEIRLASYVGKRQLLHQTSSGKVLLAYLSGDEVKEIVESAGLPAATENTITSMSALQEELTTIRERGYAIDNQESGLGIQGVAAPIFDHSGKVVASIAVGGSVFELEAQLNTIIDLVKKTAQQVSEKLGN